MAAAVVDTKVQVFTKDELDALRKALNEGRNGDGNYSAPPQEWREESDDWTNDIALLVKFLYDLRDVLSTLIATRLPPQHRNRFAALLENLAPNIAEAITALRQIDDPDDGLFKFLDRLGLVGDSLLAKLDEFRDRIVEGPVKGVLEMGDTILDSLIAALEMLEPLKELKETVKNKIEFGADGEILQLGLYPYGTGS